MSENNIPTEHDDYIDLLEKNTPAQNDDYIDMWEESRKQNKDSTENDVASEQEYTCLDDTSTHNREYTPLRKCSNDDGYLQPIDNNTSSQDRQKNEASSDVGQQNNTSSDSLQQNNTPSHDRQQNKTSSDDGQQNNTSSDDGRINNTSKDDRQQNNTSSDDPQQNYISSNNREHNNMHQYKLSAAIDFGTTSCAMAYSYFEKQDEIHVVTDYSDGVATHGKIPTSILFNENKEFISFGNNAFGQYHDFAAKKQHKDVYLFRNFKMCLYDEKKIFEDMIIEDVSGKQMDAMDVFVAALKYFKDTLLEDMKNRNESLNIQERDIHWMVTVPAIWCDRAKEFMRKAAEKAGCYGKFITIALEPEAASIYCRKFSIDKDKQSRSIAEIKQPKYLLIDIGGGTLDISAHGIKEEGSINEIYRTSGNDLGGAKVDNEFAKLLETVLSKENFEKLKRESDEFTSLMQEFQSSKRKANYANNQDVSINVPQSIQKFFKKISKNKKMGLTFTNGKLFISQDEIIKLIKTVSEKIQSYLASLLKENDQFEYLDFLILVGGFSNSKIVVNDIKALSKIPVIVPEHAELCVVKGAVMFGAKEDIIRSRKSRKTYGFGINKHFIEGKHDDKRAFFDSKGKKYCSNCFDKLITINDDVPYNHKVRHIGIHPHREGHTTSIKLYAADDPNPVYDDVDGVTFIGEIDIPKPKGACGKRIHKEVYFGQTEIKVIVKDAYSGKTFEGNFSFLSNNILKIIN